LDEVRAFFIFIQREKRPLNENKAYGGCHRFLDELFEQARKKCERNFAEV
jgi:hypothetical protein